MLTATFGNVLIVHIMQQLVSKVLSPHPHDARVGSLRCLALKNSRKAMQELHNALLLHFTCVNKLFSYDPKSSSREDGVSSLKNSCFAGSSRTCGCQLVVWLLSLAYDLVDKNLVYTL